MRKTASITFPRTAVAQAVRAQGPNPPLFAVTTALEQLARERWGPAHQGQRQAPWETGLYAMGLGTTRDVRDALAVIGR